MYKSTTLHQIFGQKGVSFQFFLMMIALARREDKDEKDERRKY